MSLSPKLQRMLDFIREFILEIGYPPSPREIGRAMGITSTAVVKHNLSILEKAGYIQRDLAVSRGIRVLKSGSLCKPTVFISYSHSDSQFVDWLADKLKASGVDVWIDKWKIKVGDSIIQQINEGIGGSDFLIVVLSRDSVNSKWVREELNAATIKNVEEEKHAFILPVLIEECELPSLLQHRKYANFKDDPGQAFQELIEAIQPLGLDELVVGPIRLNTKTYEVHIGDRSLALTPVEFELLSYLMRHPGEVFSADRLLQEVWGYPPGLGSPDLVRVHIRNLRLKLERDPRHPKHIRTVGRFGYTIRQNSNATHA